MAVERLESLERLRTRWQNNTTIKKLGIGIAERIFAITGVKEDSESKLVRALRTEYPKVYPEISLQEEWNRQAERLLEFGFARELKLSKEEYLASLPRFEPQPEEFKGKLETPLLVETRIPVEKLAELARVDYSEKIWVPYEEAPYTTWTDEGSRFMNRSVEDVFNELTSFERGGTYFDGFALYIAKPYILHKRFLDLPGTVVDTFSTACLRVRDGRACLSYNFADSAHPGFGSLVCGRKTKNLVL